jgi:DNA-binding NarL/FixJ family response regulator
VSRTAIERGPDRAIAVLIADDHEAVREGLRILLSREPDIEVIAEASTAEETLEHLESIKPRVAVIDYGLRGMTGDVLCREIAERHPYTQVVVHSAYLDEEVLRASLWAGAAAYVVKDLDDYQLKHAIRAAARGEAVIDPKVAGRVISWAIDSGARGNRRLGPPELEVLKLASQGFSDRDIASRLKISRSAVRARFKAACQKLRVTDRGEAISVALVRSLI